MGRRLGRASFPSGSSPPVLGAGPLHLLPSLSQHLGTAASLHHRPQLGRVPQTGGPLHSTALESHWGHGDRCLYWSYSLLHLLAHRPLRPRSSHLAPGSLSTRPGGLRHQLLDPSGADLRAISIKGQQRDTTEHPQNATCTSQVAPQKATHGPCCGHTRNAFPRETRVPVGCGGMGPQST